MNDTTRQWPAAESAANNCRVNNDAATLPLTTDKTIKRHACEMNDILHRAKHHNEATLAASKTRFSSWCDPTFERRQDITRGGVQWMDYTSSLFTIVEIRRRKLYYQYARLHWMHHGVEHASAESGQVTWTYACVRTYRQIDGRRDSE